MKITLYTVSDCQFSKAEKEYLTVHNLPFEEKNLEQNREWLSEMLAVSNNFAGTPVTKIEKDDGQIVIVKGYNKEELDNILGLTAQNTTTVNSTVNVPQSNQPPTQTPSPQPTLSPEPQTPPPAPPTTSSNTDNPLNDVLNNLQQKAQEPINPTPESPTLTTDQSPSPPPPPANLPNLPDFND